jgi:serine protease Do
MFKTSLLFLASIILLGLALLAACSSSSATTSTAPAAPGQNSPSPAISTPIPIQTTTVTVTTVANTPVNTPTAVSPPPTVTVANVVNLAGFADLLDVAEHTVVEIDTTGTATTFFGRTVQVQGAGSGWIMDASGTIVTNEHVIDGADTIKVTTLDGKSYSAQVINSDTITDLAVLKIDATQLPVLKIGDAAKLRTGDWVLAIGNPLGQGIIATQGIVSALKVDLTVSATQTYSDLIQTTAAINPGNSGGPLINLAGEVIGITSVKVSASGIEGMGYAISMVDALPEINKLLGK